MDHIPYLVPLDTAQLRAAAIPEPWTFGLKDRVRFGEIDALNHVNHTAPLRWFEALRVRWFARQGISDYGPGAPRIVLRNISAHFIRELVLGEDYIVTGRATQYRHTSFSMDYAVHVPHPARPDPRIMASSVIVILDPATGARKPLTEVQKETLRADGAVATG